MGLAKIKSSSFSFLRPDLAQRGFTVTAFKRHAKWVTVRIAWVFPKHRTTKPINKYIHAISIRYLAPQIEISTPEVVSPNYNDLSRPIAKRFLDFAGTDLTELLSEAGKQAVFNSFNQIPAERTLKTQEKISFVRDHPELWDSPSHMANALIAENFYSRKTPKSQVVWTCETFIREVRSEGSRSLG